jgi:hypothetical protein
MKPIGRKGMISLLPVNTFSREGNGANKKVPPKMQGVIFRAKINSVP